MESDQLFKNLIEYGFAGLIFAGFLLVLKWVFAINKEILCAMNKEREAWQFMIKGFAENIKENTQSSKDFQAIVNEAHTCQRKEHTEIIQILGRINGYRN